MYLFAIEHAVAKHMRVDVLVWDTYGGRRRVKSSDGVTNLQRMHYHLFRNSSGRAGPTTQSGADLFAELGA